VLTIVTLTLTACATAEPRGQILTGKNGMTLYSFDRDVPRSGKSACYGDCTAVWVPVPVADASGAEFGSLGRADGTRQLTYHGQPLYYYVQDRKPGDAHGDNANGVWHALRGPAPVPQTSERRGFSEYSSYSY
jgi:predicted lipoprotein with Yx(FWY)xxD motif